MECVLAARCHGWRMFYVNLWRRNRTNCLATAEKCMLGEYSIAAYLPAFLWVSFAIISLSPLLQCMSNLCNHHCPFMRMNYREKKYFVNFLNSFRFLNWIPHIHLFEQWVILWALEIFITCLTGKTLKRKLGPLKLPIPQKKEKL